MWGLSRYIKKDGHGRQGKPGGVSADALLLSRKGFYFDNELSLFGFQTAKDFSLCLQALLEIIIACQRCAKKKILYEAFSSLEQRDHLVDILFGQRPIPQIKEAADRPVIFVLFHLSLGYSLASRPYGRDALVTQLLLSAALERNKGSSILIQPHVIANGVRHGCKTVFLIMNHLLCIKVSLAY
jgi:hypothetical protein